MAGTRQKEDGYCWVTVFRFPVMPLKYFVGLNFEITRVTKNRIWHCLTKP